MAQPGARLISYLDPLFGTPGFVAFAGDRHRLAAGGLRVRAGTTGETVAALAQAMALKQRLLRLGVDGAKAGIDLDPQDPSKAQVLRRFIRFLRPHLQDRLSLGPDMGTTWAELEELAVAEGIGSVKAAIARAQELHQSEFLRRIRVLDARVGGLTLAQRRAGHAVAHAALSVAREAPAPVVRMALQGFGTLGRGTALSLAEAGARITALADEHTCLTASHGLDIGALLALPPGHLAGGGPAGHIAGPPDMLFEAAVDVLVLASCENAVTPEQAANLQAHSVVVGANLGLSPVVESALHGVGITVVPDFVAGCGGSASMDALFGPPSCPSARGVLDHVGATMDQLIRRMMARGTHDGVTPRAAALSLCEYDVPLGGRPYGRCRQASRSRHGLTVGEERA